jgi:hypothetical protein
MWELSWFNYILYLFYPMVNLYKTISSLCIYVPTQVLIIIIFNNYIDGHMWIKYNQFINSCEMNNIQLNA